MEAGAEGMLRCLRAGVGLCAGLMALALAGCATYGDQLAEAHEQAARGDFEAAAEAVDRALDPEGDEALLYHMELGILAHLQGDYSESIRLLGQAELLGEQLYTRRVRDGIRAILTNPSNSPYSGAVWELAYIHYYQALNYLMLAQAEENWIARRNTLDSALVEARKLDSRLNELADLEGDYRGGRDEEERTASGLMRVFNDMDADVLDRDDMRFREGAWLRYLTGALYEQAGDLDDALIAYRRAARLYEEGYAARYGLGPDIAARAWFDKYRLLYRLGDWDSEVEARARERLGPDLVEAILDTDEDSASVLVIEHAGDAPRKGELNLMLRGSRASRSLIVEPFMTGDYEERQAQWAWFHLMFADTTPFGLMVNYQIAGVDGFVRSFTSKTFFLGPLWNDLERMGVADTLVSGVRIAIPYYDPDPTVTRPSELRVHSSRGRAPDDEDMHRQPMLPAESLLQLAYQEQIRDAGREMRRALVRETVRTVVAHRAGDEIAERVDDSLLALLIQLGSRAAAPATAGADTRGWQTLPAEIRIARVDLDPGDYHLGVATSGARERGPGRASETVSLEPGELRILPLRPQPAADQDGNWAWGPVPLESTPVDRSRPVDGGPSTLIHGRVQGPRVADSDGTVITLPFLQGPVLPGPLPEGS